VTERQEILKRLKGLSESKLRKFIVNYSKKELGDSAEIHGSGEHGIDVVTLMKPDRDPLGLGQTLLFQVKKDRITLGSWRNNLSGQLAEMYVRTIRALNINEMSPRRVILLYNDMTPAVHEAISDWNKKIPIPIELLPLHVLASILDGKGFKAREIRRMAR